MLIIKADGLTLYSPTLTDKNYQVLDKRLDLESGKAGSLSFILPPGHVMRERIEKMKTVITVERDGIEIFRGRALECRTDFFNQAEYYCEGALAYLLDSLQRPYTFTGTTEEYLAFMIQRHNEQVEEDRRFALGRVTAGSTEQKTYESATYINTLNDLESMLTTSMGGILQTRYENGTLYLDYLATHEGSTNQPIQFGVNLLDLEDLINEKDVYTVIVPTGAVQEDGAALTIASVNGGKDYIENADGIARYGRIVKQVGFEQIEDPAQLKKMAQEKLESDASVRTLTIKAVDLADAGIEAENIQLGDAVHLYSLPHGLDKVLNCTAISGIFDLENTTFIFGQQPETLTGSNANMGSAQKSMATQLKHQHRHLTETEYALNINIEKVDEVLGRVSRVEVDVDANKAAITLKAEQETVNWLTNRVTSAEIAIDGANANILLKADASVTDELETRVGHAELEIDGMNSTISLKADKIDLQGYVTAQQLETAKAEIEVAWSELIRTDSLYVTGDASITGTVTAGTVSASGAFRLGGDNVSKTSITVITGISGGGVNGTNATLLTTNVGGVRTIEAGSADALSTNYTQGELYKGTAFDTVTATTYHLRGAEITNAYFQGSRVKLRGTKYSGRLYDADGNPVSNLYLDDGDYVNMCGNACGTLYQGGGDVTVSVGTNERTTPLYNRGTYHSGGLYTNFSPATITLQDITALTA